MRDIAPALVCTASPCAECCRLDRMASCELAAACPLGIVDYVASHAEPHVEHEGINRKQEAGHGSQV